MSEELVGEVTHYFQDIGVAVIEAHERVEVGEELYVEGATDDFAFEVESMEIDHDPVEAAEPGQAFGVKVPERAHEGSDVYRAS